MSLADSLGFRNLFTVDIQDLNPSAIITPKQLVATGIWGKHVSRPNLNFSLPIVTDSKAANTPVLQINYPAGTYRAPNGTAPVGGAQFYVSPSGNGSQRAFLEYSVFFPVDFPFALGGKLPGLYGSMNGSEVGCTGGISADGTNCW